MEMPIRIMITLFVALIVGSTIIVFSKQMIESSRQKIENTQFTDDDVTEEDKIISVSTLDSGQIVDLMEECHRRYYSETFEKELCFVVMSQDPSPTWYWADIENSFNATNTVPELHPSVSEGDYAFSIYFDPTGVKNSVILTK